MMKHILAFYLGCLLAITTATAQPELTSAGENTPDQSHISLPRCVDDAKTIKDIEETIAANKKSKEHKYKGYKKALESSTDLELVTRLAYAEVLAANCSTFNSKIIRPIAEVISNRIAIRKNNIRSVIFQFDNFASSLHTYSSAKYKDFLCPKDLTLWQEVHTQMEIALQRTEDDSTRLLPRDAVHYYLFKHDKKFKKPDWAEGPRAYPLAEFKDSGTVKECVKFYRNSRWE